jgi:hypothetical protein
MRSLILSSCILTIAFAFGPAPPLQTTRSIRVWSTTQPAEESQTTSNNNIEPKEAVKLFGRLAEKFIMLDSSGGACCYSACSDCEFRLPGGGYIMADQTAARPKWIPAYETRSANGKEHTTKWSNEIFENGPAVTKDEFLAIMMGLAYVPPLGGPYVGASAATVEDMTATEKLFEVLTDGKKKLTRHRMSIRLKQLADGEEGLTWMGFQSALGVIV